MNNQITGKEFTLEDLPTELLFKILGFLEKSDLLVTTRVSRKLREISKDPTFWKRIEIDPSKHSIRYVTMLSKHCCPGLKELRFSGEYATSERQSHALIQPFVDCEFLEKLHFNESSILGVRTTELIADSFPRLKELTITHGEESSNKLNAKNGAGLIHLARLESLEKLDIKDVMGSKHGELTQQLRVIAENFKNLKELRLSASCVSESADLFNLIEAHSDKLRRVDLYTVEVSDPAYHKLAECKLLEELSISHGNINDSCLASFRELEHLKKIELVHLKGVSAIGLITFFNKSASLHRLESLSLAGGNLCQEVVAAVARNCYNLCTLYVAETESGPGISHILDCKNLVSLHLGATGVSETEFLGIPKKLPLLRELTLNQLMYQGLSNDAFNQWKRLARRPVLILKFVGTEHTPCQRRDFEIIRKFK